MPEPGKTTTEILTVVMPLLQQSIVEVKRLADQMTSLNGSVRDLSIWRGAVDERHRQEDREAAAAAGPPAPAPTLAAASRLTVKEFLALLAGVSLVAGGVSAGVAKLLELVLK